MPLTYHPNPGTLVMCDFTTGFRAPEMIKKRPVVIVSPTRRRGGQLYTVVPLSTKAPNPVEGYHHKMDPASLPQVWSGKENWAKCDVIVTVSLDRLDRIMVGRDYSGKRIYVAPQVLPSDLLAIRKCIIQALGL